MIYRQEVRGTASTLVTPIPTDDPTYANQTLFTVNLRCERMWLSIFKYQSTCSYTWQRRNLSLCSSFIALQTEQSMKPSIFFWYRLKYCTCPFDVSNLAGEFTEWRSNGATSRIPLCKNTQMAGWSASSNRARFIVAQFTNSLPRIRRFYIMPLAIHSKNKVEPLLVSRS